MWSALLSARVVNQRGWIVVEVLLDSDRGIVKRGLNLNYSNYSCLPLLVRRLRRRKVLRLVLSLVLSLVLGLPIGELWLAVLRLISSSKEIARLLLAYWYLGTTIFVVGLSGWEIRLTEV